MIVTLVRHAQSRQTPIPGLQKTSLDCAHDVYLALQAHFDTDAWRHRNHDRAMKHMHFIPCVTDTLAEHEREKILNSKPEPVNPIEAVRPVVPEKFKTLKGINKLYQLNVARRGWMHCRARPCWCLHCMKDVLEGDHSDLHEKGYYVPGCTSYHTAPEHFTYHLKACTKTKGKHLEAAVTNVGVENVQLQAENISHGDWLLYWNAGAGDDLWLGRAVNNPEWVIDGGESAVLVNKGPDAKQMKNVGVGKVTIGKGGIGVNVQWYIRDKNGEEIHGKTGTLQYSVEDTPPIVQNTKYLVHCRLDKHLTQMSGAESMVRSARRLAVGVEQFQESYQGKIAKNYKTTAAAAKIEASRETWLLSKQACQEALDLVDNFVFSA